MDLHLTSAEPTPEEQDAVDGVLGPAADPTATERAATGAHLRAERGGQVVRSQRHRLLPALHFMSKRAGSTVVEVKGSHAVYVSKPEAVAALIEKAAQGLKLAAN